MTMVNERKDISRRGLMKAAAIGVFGGALVGIASPRRAFADLNQKANGFSPSLVVKAVDSSTGKLLAIVRETIEPAWHESRMSEAKEAAAPGGLVECWQTDEGTSGLISATSRIPLRASAYREETKESDDGLELYVKLVLGVSWGEGQSSIQIQRGSFSVSQKSPLVTYSNTGYAMMQKSRFVSDLFNEPELTVETGWPADSFDTATDQYTCGGAVTGSGFNLMTGEEIYYTVELYL